MGYGSKSISDWIDDCHKLSKKKGWYETEFNVPEKLALIHSEVSEALESYRRGEMKLTGGKYVRENTITKPEGFPSELADVVIRCFDLAGAMGIDLEGAIRTKHEYNETRPHRHGGKAL